MNFRKLKCAVGLHRWKPVPSTAFSLKRFYFDLVNNDLELRAACYRYLIEENGKAWYRSYMFADKTIYNKVCIDCGKVYTCVDDMKEYILDVIEAVKNNDTYLKTTSEIAEEMYKDAMRNRNS